MNLKTFDVHNEIDDSDQENINEEQLETETMIVEAIEKGALFLYEFQKQNHPFFQTGGLHWIVNGYKDTDYRLLFG